MADLGMVRILGRAAACVVADVVAGARDVAGDYLAALRVGLPTGVGDYDGPVGEYPDLPNVPAPAWATAPAPVPGGGSPAAAGDHPTTSALLDLAGLRIGYLAADAGKSSDVLDDFITDLYERAEACRAVEAMTRPLGDMLTDAAVETDQLAALGDPAYLVARTNLSDALIAAAALVSRAVPHPADLSGGASRREVDSPAKRGP